MQEQPQGAGWKQFYQLIKKTNPPKKLIAIALTFSMATTLVSLVVPLFTKNLVDGFSLSTISGGQIALLAVRSTVSKLEREHVYDQTVAS